MAKRMDISLGTVIRALSRTRLRQKKHTKLDCRPQEKCGVIGIKLLLLPTSTKTICTTISALTPYPSLTAESMIIPKQSNESSVVCQTVYVPNTACRLSRTRIKHRHGKCGSTRKAVNPPVTTCTVRTCEKPLITAEVPNISRNICKGKDI